jgi:hypothetical protein
MVRLSQAMAVISVGPAASGINGDGDGDGG